MARAAPCPRLKSAWPPPYRFLFTRTGAFLVCNLGGRSLYLVGHGDGTWRRSTNLVQQRGDALEDEKFLHTLEPLVLQGLALKRRARKVTVQARPQIQTSPCRPASGSGRTGMGGSRPPAVPTRA
ncbi:hypothetical protein D7W81_28025 [Corallococcus aberystwythensis]|uniref:Uncharacterized protein n=1 Tax=Corallococcus aberystwythensis TaxID=2316722 RepID=A0A3A8PRD9_9BACT|nr:hypothetical protein D7W81_28025 [Corallococcus aberystwythensis]